MKWHLLLFIFCFVCTTICTTNGEPANFYNNLCIKNQRPDTQEGLMEEENCLHQESENLRQRWNALSRKGQISQEEQELLLKEKTLVNNRIITLSILAQKSMEELSAIEQLAAKAILLVTGELLMPQFHQARNEALVEFNKKITNILEVKSYNTSLTQPTFKKWLPILKEANNIEEQTKHLISYWEQKKANYLTKKDKEYLLDNLMYIQFDMAYLQIDSELVKLQNNNHQNIKQNNIIKQQLLQKKALIKDLQNHCFHLMQEAPTQVSTNNNSLLQEKIHCIHQLL